jgi:hypothetical protein
MATSNRRVSRVAALAGLVLFAACEIEVDRQERYECDCAVICDGQSSRWVSQVCSEVDDTVRAVVKANGNCESARRTGSDACESVICSCSCLPTGETDSCG